MPQTAGEVCLLLLTVSILLTVTISVLYPTKDWSMILPGVDPGDAMGQFHPFSTPVLFPWYRGPPFYKILGSVPAFNKSQIRIQADILHGGEFWATSRDLRAKPKKMKERQLGKPLPIISFKFELETVQTNVKIKA